jgi:hypothetical protein
VIRFFQQSHQQVVGAVVAHPQIMLVLVEEAEVVVLAVDFPVGVLVIHRQPAHLKEIMAVIALLFPHTVAVAVAALQELARQALQEMVEQPRLLQLPAQQFITLVAAGPLLTLRLLQV